MKLKSVIFRTAILLFAGGASKAQWQMYKDTSLYPRYYSSIAFVSDSVGFLVGCSEFSAWNSIGLFRTTNGGRSWGLIEGASGGGCQIPNSFPDGTTGYSMISFGTFQPNELHKTTDGGLSWHKPDTTGNLQLGTSFSNDNIYFASAQLGFISKNNVIYRTTNGGKSWQTVSTSHTISCFFFTSPQTGYAAGEKVILKTVDGGSSWSVTDTSCSVLSLFFPSPTIGYATGTNRTILKTTNGGNSWFPQSAGISDPVAINSVFCPDNMTCYAVGEKGTILNTTDGGISWIKQHSGLNAKLNAISCTATQCTAVGDTSVLLRIFTGITGIKSNRAPAGEIRIFPNPFSTETTLKMNLQSQNPVTVVLYTVLGEVAERMEASPDQEIRIGRADLMSGLYIVHIIQEAKTVLTGRLILTD